ncbi:response regulator [Actinoplanes sp. NPDC026619]|uniref:response regulator n=1 Tax=Actinoplanes sp. NPDC026619 TaxID=3155798 RepID=UPI0033CF8B60
MNENLILIAEDDGDVRDMLAFALESAGYRTVAAKDGNTALRILTVAKPVGLITDVRMPALNGMELCQFARRSPEIRDTAILMISSNAHAYDVDAGLGAGADRYLPKPLSPRRLVVEMQDLITNRRSPKRG